MLDAVHTCLSAALLHPAAQRVGLSEASSWPVAAGRRRHPGTQIPPAHTQHEPPNGIALASVQLCTDARLHEGAAVVGAAWARLQSAAGCRWAAGPPLACRPAAQWLGASDLAHFTSNLGRRLIVSCWLFESASSVAGSAGHSRVVSCFCSLSRRRNARNQVHIICMLYLFAYEPSQHVASAGHPRIAGHAKEA